jgi:hypothetical protein
MKTNGGTFERVSKAIYNHVQYRALVDSIDMSRLNPLMVDHKERLLRTFWNCGSTLLPSTLPLHRNRFKPKRIKKHLETWRLYIGRLEISTIIDAL